VISWLADGGGWGTREEAIPGEWAALVLIMVLGAVLGLLVLWFTVLRHERIVRRRAARRPGRTRLVAGPEGIVALAGIGPAADERSDEAAGVGESAQELASAAVGVEAAAVEPEVDAEVDAEAADGADEQGEADRDGVDEEHEEHEEVEEKAPKRSAEPAAHGKRKLTDEILSRVESELAGREAPRWKEMAELVHREFGVSVHPSSIQKAVKRRRQAAAQGGSGRTNVSGTTEPAPASA
jgi:hypothetical protein